MTILDKARKYLLGYASDERASATRAKPGNSENRQTGDIPLLFRRETALLEAVPLFAPFSSGAYEDLTRLAVQSVNDVFPRLALLCKASGIRQVPIVSVEEFAVDACDRESAAALKSLFDHHGSDKASVHRYHLIYGRVLRERAAIRALLEVGLGTHHTDVVSNMGANGRPGSSLRAFRDFLPQAQVFGADVDRRILFEEERITTHFVDQNDLDTFEALGIQIGSELDIVIDDGLHTPSANLAVVLFALDRLRVGGWLIIEDILPAARPVWEVVGALMPADYEPTLVTDSRAMVFVARRLVPQDLYRGDVSP